VGRAGGVHPAAATEAKHLALQGLPRRGERGRHLVCLASVAPGCSISAALPGAPTLFTHRAARRGRCLRGLRQLGGPPCGRTLCWSADGRQQRDRGASAPGLRSLPLCRRRDIAFHCAAPRLRARSPAAGGAGHRSAQPRGHPKIYGPKGKSAPGDRSSPEPGPQQHWRPARKRACAAAPCLVPPLIVGLRWPRSWLWPDR